MAEEAKVIKFPQAPDAVELRHLRAFVAVAEELNFGRAADRLYISQPALSRQIRSLEGVMGTELLLRSTHSVALTIAGESLLERARKLLAEVDAAVAEVQSLGGELVGRAMKLWEPVTEQAASDADMRSLRDAYEELCANFSPPEGVRVRPVNAGGVSSLLVGADPAQPPTALWFHGGGFVLGSAFGYRPLAGALALAADAAVLVPDYRLAPEHPHPAALDDALAAYEWLLERAGDPAQVTVGGDSAGGGLAMSLLLTLRERGLPLPGGALLFCPAVDFTAEPPDEDDEARVLAFEIGRRFAEAYLGDHPPDDPIVSPLRADLAGLPPILVQAATGDDKLADARSLAERARAHGVYARLELYPVDAHVFQLFWSFLPEAADAVEAAGEFAREVRGAAEPEGAEGEAGA